MTRVYFYEPHDGVLGPGIPLPPAARRLAERYAGKEGDLEAFLDTLRALYPHGEVRDWPPGQRLRSRAPHATTTAREGRIPWGTIQLTYPAPEGDITRPRSSWRMIKYRPVREAVTA